jgi:hypothetical protein
MDNTVPVMTWADPEWWILVLFVVCVVGLIVLGYRSIPPDLEPPHYPSTQGQDYEALSCVLSDPNRTDWPERTLVLAGRAALRSAMRRNG